MQGVPGEEETYVETADAFGVGARDEQAEALMSRLIMVDLPTSDVTMKQREHEQQQWLESTKNIKTYVTQPAPYPQSRMIGVTTQYAVCFELTSAHEDPAWPAQEAQEAVQRDASYYEQRLKRCATQLQCTLLIQECNTRSTRTGTSFKHVIERASALRETFPRATDMLELAEHPTAVAAANAAVNRAPAPKPKDTRPRSQVIRLGPGRLSETSAKKKNKKKKKKKKKKKVPSESQPQAAVIQKEDVATEAPNALQQQEEVAATPPLVALQQKQVSPKATAAQRPPLVKRKIRVCRIDTGHWPEPESRQFIPCFSDAKVSVNGTCLIVVDNQTRIRVYKMYDVRGLAFEHVLSDPEGLLGSPVDIALRDDGTFVVAYPQHIVVCGQITDKFVIKLDKPVVTCVAFHEDRAVVVGTCHGSIYYYDVRTGEPEGLIDTQWDLPVLGCRAQGPNMLVWDQRNVYRYHASPDIVAPYQFCASRPLGAAGCGSLLFAMNETGSLWISDTISQASGMRQVLPPKSLVNRFMLDAKNHVVQIAHEKQDVKQDFYRLRMPITYGYRAVACDRFTCTIMYPDGTCSRLTLEL